MLSKEDLSNKYSYPAYSSDSTNNGIIGYTNKPEFICNEENPVFVTFGDHTRTMNIARKSFSVLDNVKVLKPIFTTNEKLLLFVFSIWKKKIPNLGYARHWKLAKDCLLQLPITSTGEIDFAFMEKFISELEEERISELNAYLEVTGLKDYTLTPEEEIALQEFSNITWEDFNVVDLFRVKNTHNILSSEIIENSGEVPYLCASAENNAVSSYIKYNEDFLDEGNCIFIGGKTFVVSYQENDFFSNDSHNLALYHKKSELRNLKNQLFLSTCIKRSLQHLYSWGDSISNKKIQKDVIKLPIKNNSPDYSTMETFISAIQKLVIKDVVLYADKKINATKNVIHNS